MNSVKSLLCVVAVFGFASAASAQTASKVYLGVGVGTTKANLNSTDFNGTAFPGLSTDDKDTGYKLFGGYRLNQWLAGEIAYADLGKAHTTFTGGSADYKMTSWSGALVGTWPLAAGFSLLGKLGVSYNKAEINNASKSETLNAFNALTMPQVRWISTT